MSEDPSDSDPQALAYFSPRDAWKQEDGTIIVPTHGNSVKGIWDGLQPIGPNDKDYKFWVWLLGRWRYRSSLDSEDIPILEGEFAKDLRLERYTTVPINEAATDYGPQAVLYFHPLDATKLEDGTISVPAGGFSEHGMWDGLLKIIPNHGDHKFWVWLLKHWPYRSSLNSQDIPILKCEYEKDVAS